MAILVVSCTSEPGSIPDQSLVETALAQLVATAAEETASAGNQIVLTTETIEIITQTPSVEDTKENNSSRDNEFALNYLTSQNSGDVTVEIGRVLIGDKDYIEEAIDIDFDECPEFQDKPVVGEIIFIVTNNTNQVITIYPDRGTVVIGSEQIDLFDFSLCGAVIGEDIGGDFFPGVTAIGGLWFGIKRSSVNDVTNMIVSIDAPRNQEYDELGPDYYLDLDLSNHVFEEYPPELK